MQPVIAAAHTGAFAAGLDTTRRDAPSQMESMAGRPWAIGEAFDPSPPIGPIHPLWRSGELPSGMPEGLETLFVRDL